MGTVPSGQHAFSMCTISMVYSASWLINQPPHVEEQLSVKKKNLRKLLSEKIPVLEATQQMIGLEGKKQFHTLSLPTPLFSPTSSSSFSQSKLFGWCWILNDCCFKAPQWIFHSLTGIALGSQMCNHSFKLLVPNKFWKLRELVTLSDRAISYHSSRTMFL